MLTDREIEAAYTRMRDRIDLVNAEYLKAVARQINAIGGLNASSIRKLAQMRIKNQGGPGQGAESVRSGASRAFGTGCPGGLRRR